MNAYSKVGKFAGGTIVAVGLDTCAVCTSSVVIAPVWRWIFFRR